MRAPVTGASGFIGTHVVRALQEAGHQAVGVGSRRPPATTPALQVDLTRKEEVEKLPTEVDAILHLAAAGSAGGDDPLTLSRGNTLTTLHLLEFARSARIPCFVYASSWAVYGRNPHPIPITEDHPLVGETPYAASKIGGELLCHVYREVYGMSVAVLRLCYVYGPGMHPSHVFARFLARARAGEVLEGVSWGAGHL